MNSGCANILTKHLATRQRRNSAYTLRAFARDLGMHPGSLSGILSGKRQLPFRRLKAVCERLHLTPRQCLELLGAWRHGHPKAKVFDPLSHAAVEGDELAATRLSELHYEIIAEWEHYALITLMDTHDFRSDTGWMAKRLRISEPRIKIVLQRLVEAGLVHAEHGSYVRIAASLSTSEDVSSSALVAAHGEELDLARAALDRLNVPDKDFSSVTVAVNPVAMPRLKAAIRRFRNEMIALAQDAEASEVYQLCLQFFPLTELRSRENRDDENAVAAKEGLS